MEAVGRFFACAVMVSCLVVPTTLLAQDRTSAGIKTRMGVAVTSSIQTLEVKTFEGTVLATLAPGGRVWKASISPGKSVGPDFSAIVPGDRVLMRGIQVPSGKFVADEVWANLVSFHGRRYRCQRSAVRGTCRQERHRPNGPNRPCHTGRGRCGSIAG